MSNFISEVIAVKKKLRLVLLIAAPLMSHGCDYSFSGIGPIFKSAEVVEVVVSRLA